jgi:SAM-dependent methyltransferase
MNTPRLDLSEVHRSIDQYYTRKLRRFGPTQALRFRQLLKLCDFQSAFSLNDLGCGYGALVEYLACYHPETQVDYLGLDLSRAMVRRAGKLWSGDLIRFQHGCTTLRVADYSLASGIFNVMLDQPLQTWEQFIQTTLQHLQATSRRGFAVNFVSEGRLDQTGRRGIYYTSPDRWIKFCRDQFGSDVALIDDYGMREFTLVVKNSE